MRKKVGLFLLIAGVLLTGCGGQYQKVEVPTVTAEVESERTEPVGESTVADTTAVTTADPMEDTSVTVTEEPATAATAPSETESMAESQSQSVPADEPDYYGKYQVTGLKGTAAVYAMSDEEIEAEIGRTLSYGPESLDYEEASIDLTPEAYEEAAYPAAQLYEDFRITASDLGITAEEIRAVSVLVEGNFFGNYFFVIDADTLLIYYEGVFFEAKRI